MIGKVLRQQIVKMLSVSHATRGAVSADEPAFRCNSASAVEFEHEQVLQSLIDFFPRDERLPTDDEMRVGFVEAPCFQSPTFLLGNVMREDEDLSLQRVVEDHCLL